MRLSCAAGDNVLKRHYKLLVLALLALCLMLFVRRPGLFPGGETMMHRLRGRATVADRLTQYGEAARARLRPHFERQGVAYPPRKLVLVGLKQEKHLEVYAADAVTPLRFIRAYVMLGASGKLGPKLREGDLQVPEGLYRIESLNPNSAFHLALRVNYPNEFDRRQAAEEGRSDLGGNIMIHGDRASIGCLAMGDEAAEDLFVLAADAGRENISVILSPVDFRKTSLPRSMQRPPWADELYARIKAELRKLPESLQIESRRCCE